MPSKRWYVPVRLTDDERAMLEEVCGMMARRQGGIAVGHTTAMRAGLARLHRALREGEVELASPEPLPRGPVPREQPSAPKRPRGRPRKGRETD